MEYLNFSLLTEEDFNEIVLNAGGCRYTDDPKIKELNCDYILDDAVIELKIIEEEPISKKEKQKKFINLFPAKAKTVVLNPTSDDEYEYYKILATPIKNQLKKASKQLQESVKNIDARVKISIIMNNGLTMISPNEFRKIAIERAKNDTSGIDVLIVCGIYYFSDKFDMRVLAEFKDIQIRKEKCDSAIKKLRLSWNDKIESYMTMQMINSDIERKKEPIQDLFFEHNGVRYVKPPIQWGEPSKFYPKDRPREDSTNEDDFLPLVSVVPTFDLKSYDYVKNNLAPKEILQDSFIDYIEWIKKEQKRFENKLHIMLPILVFMKDLEHLELPFSINKIQNTASSKYEKLYSVIENSFADYTKDVGYKNFILIEAQEIGIDKANDIAYISNIIIDEKSKTTKQNWLVEGERIKYEYAKSLAISYCLLLKAEAVCYHRNEDFKWK